MLDSLCQPKQLGVVLAVCLVDSLKPGPKGGQYGRKLKCRTFLVFCNGLRGTGFLEWVSYSLLTHPGFIHRGVSRGRTLLQARGEDMGAGGPHP